MFSFHQRGSKRPFQVVSLRIRSNVELWEVGATAARSGRKTAQGQTDLHILNSCDMMLSILHPQNMISFTRGSKSIRDCVFKMPLAIFCGTILFKIEE